MDLTYGVPYTLLDKTEMSPTDGQQASFAGMVTSRETRTLKNGGEMLIVKFEDFTGSNDFTLFGKKKTEFGHYCEVGQAVFVTGHFQQTERGMRYNVDNVRPLDDVHGKLIEGITIKLSADELGDNIRQTMHDLAEKAENIRKKKKNTEDCTIVPVSFTIFVPQINRQVRMTSELAIPLTRSVLTSLSEMELEFTVDRNRHIRS